MNKFIFFVLGAAVGSLTTAVLVKRHYEKIANEEIKSVVDRFKQLEDNLKKDNINIETDGIRIEADDKTIAKTVDIINKNNDINNYNNIAQKYQGNSDISEENKPIVGPYVISPDEFDENGYDVCYLTYYQDDILINNVDGTVVCDPEAVIGDALEHFGEYEDDCVHVRDDENTTDYEILKSNKTFKEVYRDEED